jgi:peptidyl-Asp metalloendopeptidase
MKRISRTSFVLLMVAALFLSCSNNDGTGAAASPAVEAFDSQLSDESIAALARAKNDPSIVRTQVARLDLDVLWSKSTIDLVIFDESITLTRDRVETRTREDFSWFGKLEVPGPNQATFLIRDGKLRGSIVSSAGFYQFRPLNDGLVAVHLIDQPELGHCGTPHEGLPPSDFSAAGLIPEPSALDTDSGQIIDVLVVYSDDADAASDDIEADIQLMIDDANASYGNSGIGQRLRLLKTVLAEFDESSDSCTDRARLKDPSDGILDDVHVLRDLYGADVTAIITAEGCGCAYIQTEVIPDFEESAFSASGLGCALGQYTFAHELGHNMGARHDWYVDPTDQSPFSYNHGFNVPAEEWRSVMSYSSRCSAQGYECPRIPYWSNPDVSYGGTAMGVQEGQNQAADNRKTLNATAYNVSNFRPGSDAEICLTNNIDSEVTLLSYLPEAEMFTGFSSGLYDVYAARRPGGGWVIYNDREGSGVGASCTYDVIWGRGLSGWMRQYAGCSLIQALPISFYSCSTP